MKQWIFRLDHGLAIFEKFLVTILFFALVLLIFINILSRNLFHISYQIIFEIAPALVLWLALMGSTLALKERRHIKLELLLRFVPERVQSAANRASSCFGLAVMSILLWVSLGFVANEVAMFGNRGWFSLVFPLFFCITSLRYAIGAVCRRQTHTQNHEPNPMG